MARSAYVALYKAVMNINEDGRRPHGWHGLEGNRWIKRDTPTVGIKDFYNSKKLSPVGLDIVITASNMRYH